MQKLSQFGTLERLLYEIPKSFSNIFKKQPTIWLKTVNIQNNEVDFIYLDVAPIIIVLDIFTNYLL